MSLGLPLLVYVFTLACNDISGCPAPSLLHPRSLALEELKLEVGWPDDGLAGLLSWRATAGLLGYVLLSMVLYRVLPASEVEGVPLSSGGRLKYRLNSECLWEAELFACLLSPSSLLPSADKKARRQPCTRTR